MTTPHSRPAPEFTIERLRSTLFETFERLTAVGASPVAVYGGGALLDDLLPAWVGLPAGLTSLIDDAPSRHGQNWRGLPILTREKAVADGVRGVVIVGREPAARAMWANRGAFREAGIDVRVVPSFFRQCTWDNGLIAHEDARRARELGNDVGDWDVWPPRDHAPDMALLAPLLERLPKNAHLLEVGPGSGTYTAEVIDRARTLTLVDLSERLLFEALERRFASRAGDLRLVVDDRGDLPGVADNSIDAAYSVDCFVHVKIDMIHRWVRGLLRVLKPGGFAMLHHRMWTEDSIELWESTAPAREGTPNILHYASPDMLRATADRLGCGFEHATVDGANGYAVFTA